MNIKVGKILQCQRHKNADKLYVSQIQIEDSSDQGNENEPKTLQVCSGLVDFVPIEQMKHRKVAVLANLKASKQRGVKSEAMLLAAEKRIGDDAESNDVKVELINPPSKAKVGEKLYFEGFMSDEFPSKLKSKAWQEIQKHLKTTSLGKASYVTDEGEECLLRSINEASDSAFAETLSNAIIR